MSLCGAARWSLVAGWCGKHTCWIVSVRGYWGDQQGSPTAGTAGEEAGVSAPAYRREEIRGARDLFYWHYLWPLNTKVACIKHLLEIILKNIKKSIWSEHLSWSEQDFSTYRDLHAFPKSLLHSGSIWPYSAVFQLSHIGVRCSRIQDLFGFWTKLYFPFIIPLLQEAALNSLLADRNTLPEKCQQPCNWSQVFPASSFLPAIAPALYGVTNYIVGVNFGFAFTRRDSVVW